MAHLEDLTRGASVRGVLPAETVSVLDVMWHGTAAVELTFKDPQGKLGNRLLFRDDEASLEVLSSGPQWNFDADNLPDPDVIGAEIAEDLRAALEQIVEIQGDLTRS